ncbi:MAG: tyrosine-type recombinase/integrase [Nitrososphaeria archaeon]|nr:site-specific integrase [Conexivisphaerales archaeon]
MRKLRLEDVPDYGDLVSALMKNRSKLKLKDLAFVSFLAFTGARIGEALNLNWEDLDFKNRTVTIRQEKKRENYVRKVPVPNDFFWDILRRLREKRSTGRPFNFTERNGRYIVYKVTRKILKKRYRPHAIRHAYATFIMKKTKDLEMVRRLLGHRDYTVIREYMNYTQEDLEDELRGIFNEIETSSE